MVNARRDLASALQKMTCAPAHARRAYHIHSKYGDKVGSCYPELLAKVPGHASQSALASLQAPALPLLLCIAA